MKIFVDFEANMPREIVSIGAISETGYAFYSLIEPHEPLHKIIKKITGLTDEDFEEVPSIEEVTDTFMRWVDTVTNGGPYEFLVYGNQDPIFVAGSIQMTNDKQTKEMLQDVKDNLKNVDKAIARSAGWSYVPSLEKAYTMMGGTFENGHPHNALKDAEMLKYVYERKDSYVASLL